MNGGGSLLPLRYMARLPTSPEISSSSQWLDVCLSQSLAWVVRCRLFHWRTQRRDLVYVAQPRSDAERRSLGRNYGVFGGLICPQLPPWYAPTPC